MVSPGNGCGREGMAGTTAAKINPQNNFHDVFRLICQAERVLLGTCIISKPAIDKAVGHHAHSLDVPEVPDTVLIIPAFDLPQTLCGNVDVVVDGAVHIVVSAREVPCICLPLILVYILRIDGCSWVIRIQVPEHLQALGCQLTVECLLDGIVMMQINLSCNPHAVGIATDFLKAVLLCSACKYDNLLPTVSRRAFDE